MSTPIILLYDRVGVLKFAQILLILVEVYSNKKFFFQMTGLNVPFFITSEPFLVAEVIKNRTFSPVISKKNFLFCKIMSKSIGAVQVSECPHGRVTML